MAPQCVSSTARSRVLILTSFRSMVPFTMRKAKVQCHPALVRTRLPTWVLTSPRKPPQPINSLWARVGCGVATMVKMRSLAFWRYTYPSRTLRYSNVSKTSKTSSWKAPLVMTTLLRLLWRLMISSLILRKLKSGSASTLRIATSASCSMTISSETHSEVVAVTSLSKLKPPRNLDQKPAPAWRVKDMTVSDTLTP